MPRGGDSSESSRPRRPPARTPEQRQQMLVGLAYDEAERQIRSGGATSQLLTHFLKQATPREELELERLRRENELLTAKVEVMGKMDRMEGLMNNALEAFRTYAGTADDVEYLD